MHAFIFLLALMWAPPAVAQMQSLVEIPSRPQGPAKSLNSNEEDDRQLALNACGEGKNGALPGAGNLG